MNILPVLRRSTGSLGFFDDAEIGQTFDIGTTEIPEESALKFAAAYDPLSIHNDAEAAKSSMFGGLIVSGLLTLSAVHALSIRGGFIDEKTVICGAGIDELRFLQPVRPGDEISVTAEIIALKPPRPGRKHGIVGAKYRVANQDGILVMTFIDNHVIRTRT